MSQKKGQSENSTFKEYLLSKTFLVHLLSIIGSFIILLLIIQLWLRIYTNHGQKIELPEFIGTSLDEATKTAEENSFNIIISDSVFVVGKEGGIITDQNPKAGALVKENRKVYVTITKYGSESIAVSELPILYGNPFDQKKTELKYRDIDAVIKGYMYDPGEPNHILEVWYNDELIISNNIRKDNVQIAKGDQIHCIVSRRDGGDVSIPDLRCLDIDEATFLLETSKLLLGSVTKKEQGDAEANYYIVSQSPPYDGISNVKMGDKISVTVSISKPSDCQ